MRETQLRKRGRQIFPKPSIATVTFGRETKKKGQTVPAGSFCTSAQMEEKMMGLNKNASNNEKEIFPIVFLA